MTRRIPGKCVRGVGVAALVALQALPAMAQRVVVLSSGDTPPYQAALAGIQKLGLPTDALQVSADHEPALVGALARTGRDAVIVTLGAAAAALAARAAPTAPVVNCMVLGYGSDDSKPSGSAVSVPLDIPVETRLELMKRLLPNARNVGILFDPAQNEKRATDGAAALSRAGYTPVLEPVSGPTALPNALNRLTNRVDVLHALPDTTVYAREHSRALLLFSFRHQIPLTGPTEAWVKAGALYALDWDYADLGRYCASLGLRQLAGGKTPMPAQPRTRVIVNARSAEQLHIRWDAETKRAFDKVYE
jgi:putative ABC transport system substrate-binding protein